MGWCGVGYAHMFTHNMIRDHIIQSRGAVGDRCVWGAGGRVKEEEIRGEKSSLQPSTMYQWEKRVRIIISTQ